MLLLPLLFGGTASETPNEKQDLFFCSSSSSSFSFLVATNR
jgi:hypothetical protein